MKLKVLRVVLFFAVLIIIPVMIFVLPKEKVSYDENRTLADMPEFSLSSYLNEDFMNDFESFLSDRFVLRKQFIIVKNGVDKILGKTETDGVFNFDGNLFQCFRRDNDKITDNNNKTVNSFGEKNGNAYFVIAPTAQEIYKENLPQYLNLSDENEYIEYCYGNIETVKCINLCDCMKNSECDYLYYRTDHHWTSEGALTGYNEIAENMNLTVLSENDFDIEKVSDDFAGTLYSKTFDGSVKNDEIYFYKGKNYDKITVYNGETENKSIYFNDYLNQKDKYVSFLGENKGVLTVKNSDKRKKLLLIKDSYANCLMQYLSLDYGEITVLDLRYTKISDLKKIKAADYDQILILYNVTSYYTDTNISKLVYIG